MLSAQAVVEPGSPIDSGTDAFKAAMAAVCMPVTVITSAQHGRPHGTTVSAFSSLSLRPAMVLVSLEATSDLLALIQQTRVLGVNVLGAHASADALAFARKGSDKFAHMSWSWDQGLPRLDNAAAWLTCSVERLLPGGDHVIVTARVLSAETELHPPLTYHRRQFGTHAALDGTP